MRLKGTGARHGPVDDDEIRNDRSVTFCPSGEHVAQVDDLARRVRLGDDGGEAPLPPARHERAAPHLGAERLHAVRASGLLLGGRAGGGLSSGQSAGPAGRDSPPNRIRSRVTTAPGSA